MPDETLVAHLAMETGIGALVDPNAPRYPGKQVRDLGFGQDLRPTTLASLYATMVLRPAAPRFFDWTRWQAEDVREDYRTATLKHFGEGGIPLEESRHTDVMHRLHALQPERVYSDISFELVQHEPNLPETLAYPSLKTATSWRHTTFARMIIGERLHHLRTTEMVDPSAVWKRITELFASYCTTLQRQSYQLLSEKEQRKEMTALYFAAYEQLLFLRYEEAQLRPRYTSAILHRQHSGSLQDEHLLGLEPKFDSNHHGLRLTARRERYQSLIQHLQHQVVNGLMALVSPPIRS